MSWYWLGFVCGWLSGFGGGLFGVWLVLKTEAKVQAAVWPR